MTESCRLVTTEQLKALDDLLTPLVRKGQSIQHIYSTHKEEIPCSIRTIYRLIDENKLTVRAIDLRRKVRRKKTRKRKKADDNRTVVVKGCRVGRTYQDYEAFISAYKSGPFTGAQMDTVKGTQGSGKCLLTLYLLSYSILIVFLLPNCGAQAVIDCFDYMEKGLGTGEKSPLELISNEDSDIQKLMDLLKMHLIDADEVHLQPNLLK